MTKVRKPSELLRGNPVSIHISTQDFWNQHAAIGLLIVLKNGQPGASDGQTAAVQRVHELGLLAAFRTPADIGAARLVGFKVRAGRNLAEKLLPRQPYFQVVGLG